MGEPCRILEFQQQAKVGKIDREAGVIHDVKLLGEASRNPPPDNHVYPSETRRKALPLLEGLRVGINHPERSSSGDARDVFESMGLVRNVRDQADGTYGNWHFPPKHRYAEEVFWMAENAPHLLNFSINGDGEKRREGGKAIVESITFLESVDLVSRGATTRSIFESERKPMQRTVKELIESWKGRAPKYANNLREQVEAGLMPDSATMEEPATDEPDHETALKQGFRAAIMAALDDDSMELRDKVKKITEILKMEEKMLAKDDGEGDGGNADGTTTEGRKVTAGNLQESQRKMQLQLDARDWCADAGVTCDPILRTAFRACENEAEVRKLIESAKGRAAPTGVRSANPYQSTEGGGGRITESQKGKDGKGDGSELPAKPEDFGKWVQEQNV
jgi:hypothetical protein